MTKNTIRQKLISYLIATDDDKVNAIYTLLEREINDKANIKLSEAQIEILDEERTLHLTNRSESYTRKEAILNIKKSTGFSQHILTDVLNKKFVVISVIGTHAGEDVLHIFSRKKKEIESNLKTYWLLRSPKAKTIQIQKLCEEANKEGEDVYCLFITASTDGGARATTTSTRIKEISNNNVDWIKLDNDVKITGVINQQSTALVLSELVKFDKPVDFDLWDYSEFPYNSPIRFQLGTSTVCGIKAKSIGMKSRSRKLVAWGKIAPPFAVWVR